MNVSTNSAGQESKPGSIGIGILSWRAHDTLRKTLASYQQANLFSLFDQSIIYFNDPCPEDQAIAETFQVAHAGGENKGIAGGMQELVNHLHENDYMLLLQNDCPVVESNREIRRQLDAAASLLATGKIDIMRLRHRWKVGEGFDLLKYLRYYGVKELDANFSFAETGVTKKMLPDSLVKKVRRFFRPRKAKKLIGMSVYIEKEPDKVHPVYIQKAGDVFIIDSSVIPFTDQSFLTTRTFITRLMEFVNAHPTKRTLNGFQVPEISLNHPFWKKNHFKIGIGTGIFAHNRFDGSFRKKHHTYRKKTD